MSANNNRYYKNRKEDWEEVTIPAGGYLSSTLFSGGLTPIAIEITGDWAPADLTFQVSEDNITYKDVWQFNKLDYVVGVKDSGGRILLDPVAFRTFLYWKIRSGTPDTPRVQTSDITIKVWYGPL